MGAAETFFNWPARSATLAFVYHIGAGAGSFV
jgi:hypothetical protein